MKRLHRLTAILIKLQAKSTLRAAYLADHFEVSSRTIYRDLEALSLAGVPIGFEHNVGYFLVEGYQLPPLMFTEDEANALITAQKIVDQNNDSSLVAAFNEAVEKVKAVLRTSHKQELDLLEERIQPSRTKNKEKTSDSLSLLQHAITKRRVLELTYRSGSKREITQRAIEPLAIYFTQDHWVLIAYCRLRKGHREFRTDRIARIIKTDAIFPPNQFMLSDYFEKKGNFFT
ncbi:MAG: YafY family protein [Bacteroidota bacterium]